MALFCVCIWKKGLGSQVRTKNGVGGVVESGNLWLIDELSICINNSINLSYIKIKQVIMRNE